MSKPDDSYLARIMNRKMSRRKAMSNGAKLGGAVVATAVVAGGLGYYAGNASAPKSGSTSTVTNTSTQTVTVTSGGGATSATSSTAASSSGSTTTTSSQGSGPNYVRDGRGVRTLPLAPKCRRLWSQRLRKEQPHPGVRLPAIVRPPIRRSIARGREDPRLPLPP